MNDFIAPPAMPPAGASPRRLDRWAKRLMLSRLAGLGWGRLILVDGDGRHEFGQPAEQAPLAVTLTVAAPRFYSAVTFRGSLGAAETYYAGDWSADDLVGLVRLLVRNQHLLRGVEGGWARLVRPLLRLGHAWRRNTRAGSRANIAAHYDLGNDFYGLFLDETMTYSCGLFQQPGATLKDASVAKYDRLCGKLRLTPDDEVIEIGTGWGGFAIHAAGQYGCRVTTTTLSRQQWAYARDRVRQANLAGRVALQLNDYRDLAGQYDKLVSIEMIEAVGDAYLETFFATCSRLLKPHGRMALQAITIADRYHRRHVRTVDMIKKYIFPGSCLTSPTRLCQAATAGSDLRLVHAEEITPHYATTLRLWRQRFLARLAEVRSMGFDEAFIRLWEYYLAYCEGAFSERYIGVYQLVFDKPACRDEPILGQLPTRPGGET